MLRKMIEAVQKKKPARKGSFWKPTKKKEKVKILSPETEGG